MDEQSPENRARRGREPGSPAGASPEVVEDRGVEEPGGAPPGGGSRDRERAGAGFGEESARSDDDPHAPEVDRSRHGGEAECTVRFEAERPADREPDEEPRRPPRVQEGGGPGSGRGAGKEPAVEKDPECAARRAGEGERDRAGRKASPYGPALRFEEKKRKISSPASAR